MPNYSNVKQVVATTDGSSSFESSSFDISKLDKFAIQVKHDGTLDGTVSIQGCVSEADGFDDVTGMSKAITTAGTKIFDFPYGTGLTKLRIKWVRTSGTGNISAKINEYDNA